MANKDVAKREETAIEKVKAAPAWLVDAAKEDTSKDALKEHLVLPQLRMVPTSPGERMRQYKDQYGEGALVVTPAGIAVAPHDTWVKVVPLFMFTEFRKWHDRDDAGTNAVLERTTDPTSDLAKRARNEETREEAYGDLNRMVKGKVKPFMYQYVEHLCFVVLIYDGVARGAAASLEFQRGSLWTGKEFSTAALMRKVDGVDCPLWTQVWELQSSEKSGKGFTWWALGYRNPEDGQLLITDEEAAGFREDWVTHREAHKSQRLTVDLSDAEDSEARSEEIRVDTAGVEAEGM